MEQAVENESAQANGSTPQSQIAVLRFEDIYPDCCQLGNLLIQVGYDLRLGVSKAGAFYLVASKGGVSAVAQAINFCPFCGTKMPTEMMAEEVVEESAPFELTPAQELAAASAHGSDDTSEELTVPDLEPISPMDPPTDEEMNDGLLGDPTEEPAQDSSEAPSGMVEESPADESQLGTQSTDTNSSGGE